MKFDSPATTNPIDQLKVVGKPTDRIDGPLKTTGTAPYAYERHDIAPKAAYGYVVGSAIAKGRIASIDIIDAKSAPGVLAVVTTNTQQLGRAERNTARIFGGPEIFHYHQAVALVVADTAGKWPYLEDVTSGFMYLRLHGDRELYASGYT